jgi:hypothetical protein
METAMDIPRQPKEDLKQLVRDVIANQVLLSAQVPDNLISMVFMPIALGGLAYPVDEPELPKEPAKPVRGFTRPKRPEPDVGAAREGLKAAVAEAREALARAEFRARWGEVEDSEVEAAREALTRAEDALRDAEAAANRAADAAHEAALTEHRANLSRHRAKLAEWRGRMKVWREECDALQTKVKEWEAGRDAHFDKLKSDLGVVYGYYKDSMGGRAINGFPMLASCALLHREDWALVRAAIGRELDRQKEIEL